MSEWRFLLPLPPSVNHLYGTGTGRRRFKSESYEKWIKQAGQMVMLQRLKQRQKMILGPYVLTAFYSRSRCGDIGNREKALSDLLVSMSVIQDDVLCAAQNLRWLPEGKFPGACVVIVEDFDETDESLCRVRSSAEACAEAVGA